MYNSERMMKAIGDISDDKIEKTGRALVYQKEDAECLTPLFGWEDYCPSLRWLR